MAVERALVPVPVCEVCWLIDNTSWEPESVNQSGQVLMRLTGVEIPTNFSTGSVDVCIDCGSITISGIYDMREPDIDPEDGGDSSSSSGTILDQFSFLLNMESDFFDGDE